MTNYINPFDQHGQLRDMTNENLEKHTVDLSLAIINIEKQKNADEEIRDLKRAIAKWKKSDEFRVLQEEKKMLKENIKAIDARINAPIQDKIDKVKMLEEEYKVRINERKVIRNETIGELKARGRKFKPV